MAVREGASTNIPCACQQMDNLVQINPRGRARANKQTKKQTNTHTHTHHTKQIRGMTRRAYPRWAASPSIPTGTPHVSVTAVAHKLSRSHGIPNWPDPHSLKRDSDALKEVICIHLDHLVALTLRWCSLQIREWRTPTLIPIKKTQVPTVEHKHEHAENHIRRKHKDTTHNVNSVCSTVQRNVQCLTYKHAHSRRSHCCSNM